MTRRLCLSRRTLMAGSLLLLQPGIAWAEGEALPPLSLVADSWSLAWAATRLSVEGAAATVRFPVPAGTDPSFWRPSIPEIVALQEADAVLTIGHGFAGWTDRVSLANLVTVGSIIQDVLTEPEAVTHSHGPEGEHTHEAVATYVWLDARQMQDLLRVVAAVIGKQRTRFSDPIEAALNEAVAALEALHLRGQAIGEQARGKAMIAAHPRYQYFARAYGLDIRALSWESGAPIPAAGWDSFNRLMAERPARLLLWEAPPHPEAEAQIQSRGLQSVVVETLAQPPRLTPPDFLAAFAANLDRLEAALAG